MSMRKYRVKVCGYGRGCVGCEWCGPTEKKEFEVEEVYVVGTG